MEFFPHYNAIEMKMSDSVAAICKQLTHFKKRKPHHACLTFDKRLFLPQTKFM